jgi:hypothetical protein
LPADSSGAVKDSKKQPGVPDKAVRIVKTNGEQFWSYDDKVNWCGQLSFKNGQTIPYEKLKEVDISPAERGGFNVRAALAAGTTYEGVSDLCSFDGENALGGFRVDAADLKRVIFPR